VIAYIVRYAKPSERDPKHPLIDSVATKNKTVADLLAAREGTEVETVELDEALADAELAADLAGFDDLAWAERLGLLLPEGEHDLGGES